MNANDDPNPVALVHRWRAAVDTQMHFNDMLIRTRAAGMSIVVAVFGGAALAVEKFPQHVTLFLGIDVHLAAVVMFFGLPWRRPKRSRRNLGGPGRHSGST